MNYSYAFADGSAESPSDYSGGSETRALSFFYAGKLGEKDIPIDFQTVRDDRVEGTETFFLDVTVDGLLFEQTGTNTARVRIVIEDHVNAAPTVVPDTRAVVEDASAAGNVLANDSDADDDALTVTAVDGSAESVGTALAGRWGTLTLRADGGYDYVADRAAALAQGQVEVDSFTYRVDDGAGGTAETTLEIQVTGVNTAPEAAPDAASVVERGETSGEVLSNDSDVDGGALTVTAVDGSAEAVGTALSGRWGTLTLQADGDYVYVADRAGVLAAGQVEVDSFVYRVDDGAGGTAETTLEIEVTGIDAVQRGTRGDDRLVGDAGVDRLIGRAGNDVLLGGRGDDVLKGGGGADRLKGHGGDDVLFGQRGHDRLFGQRGDDRLFGGGGRDVLDGGRGHDVMAGGGGRDRFVFHRGDGRDEITDFQFGRDKLVFASDSIDSRADLTIRERGDDLLIRHDHGRVLIHDADADDLHASDFLF